MSKTAWILVGVILGWYAAGLVAGVIIFAPELVGLKP